MLRRGANCRRGPPSLCGSPGERPRILVDRSGARLSPYRSPEGRSRHAMKHNPARQGRLRPSQDGDLLQNEKSAVKALHGQFQ